MRIIFSYERRINKSPNFVICEGGHNNRGMGVCEHSQCLLREYLNTLPRSRGGYPVPSKSECVSLMAL